MASNLPPGVTDGMIPGNRPEDREWEAIHESIDMDSDQRQLTPREALTVWRVGLQAWDDIKPTVLHKESDGPGEQP